MNVFIALKGSHFWFYCPFLCKNKSRLYKSKWCECMKYFFIYHFSTHICLLVKKNGARTCEKGTYDIGKQSAHVSLHSCAVLPEPSLFAHIIWGTRGSLHATSLTLFKIYSTKVPFFMSWLIFWVMKKRDYRKGTLWNNATFIILRL